MSDITLSKCQVGQEFCRRACHSVGSVDGVCNSDFTDCDCTDEKVSFEQVIGIPGPSFETTTKTFKKENFSTNAKSKVALVVVLGPWHLACHT